MPVRSIYTVGGRIRSVHTGGAVGGQPIQLLPDALGSVVRELHDSTGVSAQARFAPYGNQLYTAGEPSTSRFQWVGAHGYRSTGNQHAEEYVRARHYSSQEARWTSRDPLWPKRSAYGYVRSAPTVKFESFGFPFFSLPRGYPAGWSTVNVGGVLGKGTFNELCGNAGWQILWMLIAPKFQDTSGFIIQHIRATRRCALCKGGSCGGEPNGSYSDEQYEAFQVDFEPSQGTLVAHGADVDDYWHLGSDVPCSMGSVEIHSNMRYYPGLTEADIRSLGFERGRCPAAGKMQYCTFSKPAGWVDRPPRRSMQYVWNCCGHPPDCPSKCTPLTPLFLVSPPDYY